MQLRMTVDWRKGALPRRGALGRWMAAMGLLFVFALLSPAEHTHTLTIVGHGVDYGVSAKPCPACISESNPGLAPDAPGILPAPEVIAVVEGATISVFTASVASATGRSPPSA